MTVIRDIRVKPGTEGRFELLMGTLIAAATQQPGYLGATVIRPTSHPHDAPKPIGSLYRFVYKFEKRSQLTAWHSSSTRAALFKPVAELILDDHYDSYEGLETWFDIPHFQSPPKWKTTLLSWVVIYILVVAMSYLLQALKLRLPIPAAVFIVTVIVVPLVAYVAAPLLGRLLHTWLHATSTQHPTPPRSPSL
ncbi:MAG TPA: antibiotic biosynthesis monooxygenase [Phycisphaerales bacterium]|nr:antibiotic biosynthesis monooxygenase [Phycisphaerales bacterium]